jgi:hypothetical protein
MATPNTLFAILDVANPIGLKEKLQQIAPWVFYELREGQWLLIAPGGTTTKEVTDKLAITTEPSSTATAIVVKVDNFYGRNFAVVWDWIKSKQGTELVPTATTTS